MTQLDERPRYYEGQYLEAADLMAAVGYTSTQRSRVLLGAHRWGIALGLDLVEVAGPNATLDMVVTPGYAWDGFGRPILVAEPAKLSVGLFASFDNLFIPGNPPPPPVVAEVWVRYEETLGHGPRPGFETCEPGSAFSRVLERFAFEAGPRPDVASRRSPIEVAGRTMDAAQALSTFDSAAAPLADASVPHQALPEEGETARWLVSLGVVRYQPGAPGHFVKRDAATLTRHARGRDYAGVVAGSVEATGGTVRIHDRAKAYSPHHTGELLSIEGDVRSDGHVRLYGHRLEFVASHAENPRKPVHVLRKDDPAGAGSTLNLVIGDKPASVGDKLVVGPTDGQDASGNDTQAARMVVTAAGRVGVGTDAPKALLHLAEDGLQIGDSAVPTDNFHVVSNTDGARALRFYGKDFGAGTPLMSLTSEGRLGIGDTSPTHALHVNGARGLRQNAIYLSGDSRWSSLTFNAHHNDSNNAWVFPDPSKPAATIEMDGIGGFPRFEVFTTVNGDNQSWQSRFRVQGHTGDVVMGHNGGNVGIGTFTPTHALHVNGARGLRQNAIYLSGDSRWSSLTFNAHHNDSNNAWVFPDPSKPAATIEMDGIGGFPRFEVFTTVNGDNQSWQSRFRVQGHTGDVVMGHNGGNVGIGTFTPTVRLDVRGDIDASGAVRLAGGLHAIGSGGVALRLAWGMVNEDGSPAQGNGFTSTRTSTGIYQIIWTPPFLARPTVLATCVNGDGTVNPGGGVAETAIVALLGVAEVRVRTFNAAGNPTDSVFTLIAIGPR